MNKKPTKRVTFGINTHFFYQEEEVDKICRQRFWEILALDRVRFQERVLKMERLIKLRMPKTQAEGAIKGILVASLAQS